MKYETPICEILKFSEEDIIRTSNDSFQMQFIPWDPTDVNEGA